MACSRMEVLEAFRMLGSLAGLFTAFRDVSRVRVLETLGNVRR